MNQAGDFWLSSGFRLLDRDGAGRLVPTPAFVAAYWRRPEVAPVEESCDRERVLHDALTDDPMRRVSDAELRALADPDAAENYRAVLRFRDFLTRFPTVEAGYLHIARAGGIDFPPMFVDHMAHVILRNALDGSRDPFRVRAGELFFRPQRVTLGDDRIMVADQAVVDLQAQAGQTLDGTASGGGQGPMVEIDVLAEANRDEYWGRSDGFDTAIDIGFAQPGLDGLARALEAWVGHLAGVACRIQPLRRIDDEGWVWHIGLDRDANAILNALYEGRTPTEEQLRQILGLFRMDIDDTAAVRDNVAGRPIYLGLAMGDDGVVRMKPQNIISNLPLKPTS
ncbi:MAG: DUF6352 family protein [Thalassobaculum sp.]|uniref:DUF6352 family protein n=1 Tax=Thalassobaculum sp. TaxID=2022740 RepID=UPI0032ED204C